MNFWNLGINGAWVQFMMLLVRMTYGLGLGNLSACKRGPNSITVHLVPYLPDFL